MRHTQNTIDKSKSNCKKYSTISEEGRKKKTEKQKTERTNREQKIKYQTLVQI